MAIDFTEALRRAGIKEFTISRTVNAPLARVWKAWTDEEQLKQWWGPKGNEVFSLKLDLRPGGTMLYGLRAPDGLEYWGRFVFHEIVPDERLVFVVSFSDAQGQMARNPWDMVWPLELLSTVEFRALGGKTEVSVRWIPVNSTEPEERAFDAARDSMKQGWGGTLDKLEDQMKK